LEQTITEHLQDSLIYLSITDSEFARIIGGQVPPEFFPSEVARDVYNISVQYIKKYNKAPGDHFHDELMKLAAWMSDDRREIVARYLTYLKNMREPSRDYVLDRLDDFIKARTLMKTTYEFAELIERGKFDRASHLMQEALKTGFEKSNIGNSFLDDFSDLNEREDSPKSLVTLNMPPIDKTFKMTRTDLVVIAGMYKGTKSWFGHYIGREGLLAGLNVLHVSHELSRFEMGIRYDMMFGALVDEEEPTEVELRWMNDGRLNIDNQIRNVVYNRDIVRKFRRKVKSWGGNLHIKKYPMDSCSPIDLDNYIGNLENFHNFKADIVINDYADVMAPIDASKQTRDSINQTYKYLKKIADERNLLMVTMSQINEDGIRQLVRFGNFSGSHLAEDKRKFANIDKGLYVGTTPELESRHEAIVGVFANRSGVQGQKCIIGQNLKIGQFAVYSKKYERGENSNVRNK